MLREESFLDTLRCDMAISELEVLLGEHQAVGFRTGSHGNLEVEKYQLLCINTFVRWPPRLEAQAELFPSAPPGLDLKETREVLLDLYDALGRAGTASRALQQTLGIDERSLEEEDRKRRKSTRKYQPS